jgi:hypothetical protein
MLDAYDLTKAFKHWSWLLEHPYISAGGYMSAELGMVLEEQQRKWISGEIREFDEGADADFIRLRMIAAREAEEAMQGAIVVVYW